MKTTNTRIPPALAARYRAAPRATIAAQIASLESFLAHTALFAAIGSAEAVAATKRAWWIDAAILAALPASSAAEAGCKLAALAPALDGRTCVSADDGHRNLRAMIATGVEAERCRWRLGAPTRH